ncbi:MAG: hypothetical protein WCP92_04000 [bacterium]
MNKLDTHNFSEKNEKGRTLLTNIRAYIVALLMLVPTVNGS